MAALTLGKEDKEVGMRFGALSVLALASTSNMSYVGSDDAASQTKARDHLEKCVGVFQKTNAVRELQVSRALIERLNDGAPPVTPTPDPSDDLQQH